MACTIKSVVLQAGESFTLPPGGQIIGVTDIGLITSTCDIPEDLEESKCYILQYAASDSNNPSNLLEINEYKLTLNILGIPYTIIDELGAGGPNVVLGSVSQITNVIPDGLIEILSVEYFNPGTDRNSSKVIFRTIPSIASTISFRLDGPDIDNGFYTYPVETECP